MAINWENGLYGCSGCDGEFGSFELTSVFGGIDYEPDYYMDTTGQLTSKCTPVPYSISLCEDCVKQRDFQIVARLLDW